MWILVGVVIAAGVLMWLAGRERGPQDASPVDEINEEGLVVSGRLIAWSSLFEVRVITRREFFKTWFGFEVRSEDAGLLSIDGAKGQGERFLSFSHQLAGFDHAAVHEALTLRRSSVVCYNR